MSDADAPDEPAPEQAGETAVEADGDAGGSDLADAAAPADTTALNDGSDPSSMSPSDSGGRSSAFMGVPIEVLICVGKARPLVSDLVKLRRDSVISLDSRIDDPVEVYIGDRLIARGELQEMEEQEGQLGVRLTEVADLSNAV